MSDENEPLVSTITPERVKEFIETRDQLAKEKPAGFAAYMATCQSAMKMMDFTASSSPTKKKR